MSDSIKFFLLKYDFFASKFSILMLIFCSTFYKNKCILSLEICETLLLSGRWWMNFETTIPFLFRKDCVQMTCFNLALMLGTGLRTHAILTHTLLYLNIFLFSYDTLKHTFTYFLGTGRIHWDVLIVQILFIYFFWISKDSLFLAFIELILWWHTT